MLPLLMMLMEIVRTTIKKRALCNHKNKEEVQKILEVTENWLTYCSEPEEKYERDFVTKIIIFKS